MKANFRRKSCRQSMFGGISKKDEKTYEIKLKKRPKKPKKFV